MADGQENMQIGISVDYSKAINQINQFQNKAKKVLGKIKLDNSQFNIDTSKANNGFISLTKTIKNVNKEMKKCKFDIDISSMKKSTMIIKASLGSISNMVKKDIQRLSKLVKTASSIGIKLGQAIAKGIKAGLSVLKSLGSFIVKIFKSFVKTFMSIGKLFGKAISTGIKACANLFKAVGITITKFISAGIKGSYHIITGSIKGLSSIISKTLSTALNTAKDISKNIGSYVSNALNQKGKATLELDVNSTGSLMSNLFSGAAIGNTINGAVNNMTAAMPKQLGNVTTALTQSLVSTATKVKDFGMLASQVYYLVKSNWSKIALLGNSILPVIKGAFTKLGTAFPGVFKAIFSKVGASIITFISPMVNKLITVAQTYLAPVMNKFVSPVINGFNLLKEGCIIAGRALISTLVPMAKTAGISLLDLAKNSLPMLKNVFSNIIPLIQNSFNVIKESALLFSNIFMNNLVPVLTNGFNTLKNAAVVTAKALLEIGKNTDVTKQDLASLGKNLKDLGIACLNFKKSIYNALAPAVGFLIKACNLLAPTVSGVVNVLTSFINSCGIVIKGLAIFLNKLIEWLQPLGNAIGKFINWLNGFWTRANNYLMTQVNKLGSILDSMKNKFTSWVDKLLGKNTNNKNNNKNNNFNNNISKQKEVKLDTSDLNKFKDEVKNSNSEFDKLNQAIKDTVNSFNNMTKNNSKKKANIKNATKAGYTVKQNNTNSGNIKNNIKNAYDKMAKDIDNQFKNSSSDINFEDISKKIKDSYNKMANKFSSSTNTSSNGTSTNSSSKDFTNTFEKMRTKYNQMADEMVSKLNAKTGNSNLFSDIKVKANEAGKQVDGILSKLGKYSILAAKIRHPFANLKAEMTKRALESIIVSAKKTATSFNDCRKAVQRFKNASSGLGKVKAGLDVITSGARTAVHGLSTVLKSNVVSKMVNKMKKPTEKASKDLSKSVPGGSKTLGFFKSALGKLTMLFGGFAIFNTFKESTKDAINFEAAMNNLVTTLGSASVAMQDWINNQAMQFGMGKKDAATYANTFSILTSSFAKDTEECQKTTQELLQQATIVASKTGRDVNDVLERFRSGILGSTEAIEDLGKFMLTFVVTQIVKSSKLGRSLIK